MAFFPQQKEIKVGPYVLTGTDITNLVVLYGTVNTSSNVATLRVANSSSGYQVPNGKTLTMRIIEVSSNASNTVASPLYGDTDVGFNSGSLPTTPVYLAGFTTTDRINLAPGGTSATAVNPLYIDFQVPQNKYPCVQLTGGSGTSVVVYCTVV